MIQNVPHAKSGKCTHPVSYGLHVSSLPSYRQFSRQFCLQVCRQVVCSGGGPLSGIKPTLGTPLMGHSGKGSSCSLWSVFSPPWWTAGENRINPRWKDLNKRAKSSKPFQVCSVPACIAVVPAVRLWVVWGYGGLACACLGCHGCRMECGVSCPCSTSGCLFSLLFFPFSSFSTSHSSLCLCVSIPPSLS